MTMASARRNWSPHNGRKLYLGSDIDTPQRVGAVCAMATARRSCAGSCAPGLWARGVETSQFDRSRTCRVCTGSYGTNSGGCGAPTTPLQRATGSVKLDCANCTVSGSVHSWTRACPVLYCDGTVSARRPQQLPSHWFLISQGAAGGNESEGRPPLREAKPCACL